MVRLRARIRSEGGALLVEVLLAIAILGIAVVTLIGALGTAVITSQQHRQQASAGAVLAQAAEAVKAKAYVNCATTGSYAIVAADVTVPSGWALPTVTAVTYWNGSAFVGTCPSPDRGLQTISLQAASPDGRATERVAVVKRNPNWTP